jgi:hypothetical protein
LRALFQFHSTQGNYFAQILNVTFNAGLEFDRTAGAWAAAQIN